MPAHPFPVERETLNTPSLDRPARAVLRGLHVKKAIVNQLIEGRLPFLEAAAQFQVAQRLSSPCLEHATGVPGGTGDSEAICRALIGWVHLALSDRPEQAELVSDRLERELQGYLERFGKISLPPVR
jgi:hypothetical protein